MVTGASRPGIGAAVADVVSSHPASSGLAGRLLRVGLAGAGIGAALAGVGLIVDRLSGGRVRELVDSVLGHRHQIAFVLQHPLMPWIGPAAIDVERRARAWEEREWGSTGHSDDVADAFRHALGAALLAQELQRRGLSQERAVELVEQAGEAHEADGDREDGPLRMLSSRMDSLNNSTGARLAGNGQAADGTWLTERQLAGRVRDAIAGGELVRVDLAARALVATSAADRPSG